MKLKLCDMGFSAPIETHSAHGSDGYKAPELYTRTKCESNGSNVDVFALGVTLFAMHFCAMPFEIAVERDVNFYKYSKAKKSLFLANEVMAKRYELGAIPADLQDLLYKLLDICPWNRPKVDKILEH